MRAKSPQRPGELVKSTGLSNVHMLRYHMKPLLKAGMVTATGSTAQRLISLGVKRQAKEGL